MKCVGGRHMAKKEPKAWITVNGQHIPIYDGESRQDAYNRAVAKHNEDVKQKQIDANKKQSDDAVKAGSNSGTNYQGKGQYAKAQSKGISAEVMYSKINELSDKVINDNVETIEVLKKIQGNPNAMVTMYRATVGDSINNGDWVFLDKGHAEKWTKTAMGTPKPNTKVVIKRVRASEIDWTGKNLEFMYNKKKI